MTIRCSRADRITAAGRRGLGPGDFALPILSVRSPGKRALLVQRGFAGAYPMDTRARGANARARAVQQYRAGNLTDVELQTIYARTARRWGFTSTPPVEARTPRRAAANRSRLDGAALYVVDTRGLVKTKLQGRVIHGDCAGDLWPFLKAAPAYRGVVCALCEKEGYRPGSRTRGHASRADEYTIMPRGDGWVVAHYDAALKLFKPFGYFDTYEEAEAFLGGR